MSPPYTHTRLVVIGFGNMGRAMVEGGLKAGIIALGGVEVVEPDDKARAAAKALDLRAVGAVEDVKGLAAGDHALLAVKPQTFGEVAAGLRPKMVPGVVVLSIMAGVTTARIAAELGGVSVVRAMPNAAAKIGQSATAVSLGAGVKQADAAFARRLLAAIGPLVIDIEESLMDAFTAVAGSGPAYLFYLAEAMVKGATEAGFTPAQADAMVRQTLAGAAGLLTSDPATPTELRARITSKGGTTEAALRVLDKGAVHAAVIEAILAARDRGRQLGKN